MTTETRFGQCELRAGFDGNRRRVSGLALPYNELSEPIGAGNQAFREKFEPTALDDGLDRNIFSLWSHDTSQPLGSTGNDTLRLSNRADGLWFDLEIAETALGDTVLTNIRSGLVGGMSIAFQATADDWRDAGSGADGLPIRSVTRAVLVELSPCIMPAYPQSSVEAARHARELLTAHLGVSAAGTRRRRLRMAELGC
jgi:HK97 family phage prohead protease